MIRQIIGLSVLVLTGCSTMHNGKYSPQLASEKKAFSTADRQISPSDVRKNFREYVSSRIAWAGIIREVEFKAGEDSVMVAFLIEHRDFDWLDHGGEQPYLLSTTGEGMFAAGWKVEMPTSVSFLKTQVKVGDMIIVYGRPYQMKKGVIQIVASSVRPVPQEEFGVVLQNSSPLSDRPE